MSESEAKRKSECEESKGSVFYTRKDGCESIVKFAERDDSE